METPNVQALTEEWRELGASDDTILRALRTFNAAAPAFQVESESYDHQDDQG